MNLSAKRSWEKEAREFFRDIINQFHIEPRNRHAFLGTCENLNNFYVAKKKVDAEGITFTTANGQIRKHPACGVMKDSWSAFLLGLKCIGLHEFQGKMGRPPGS